MTILLVEDEVGIREGLAAFLGLKGHEVHAVGSVGDAVERLMAYHYDAVVTDWRLHGEVARPILDASGDGPCVVISGSPEEVDEHPAVRRVLAKPVRPANLVAELGELLVGASDPGRRRVPSEAVSTEEVAAGPSLVSELREILAAAVALLPTTVQGVVHERGGLVEVEFESVPEELVASLARLGGDLRIDPLTGCGSWRLFADGRPAGIDVVVTLDPHPDTGQAWPRRPFAIDCSGWSGGAPALAQRVESALAAGCVACLGLEPSMRRALHALEVPLPVRQPPGPEIGGPEALLWSAV